MNNASGFNHDHLTGIEQLSAADIETILARADFFADRLDDKNFNPGTLAGKTVLNLFFENSTRTRMSFEAAAKRLGAESVNIDIGTSSVSKGETLLDTVLNLTEIVRPDAIVIRHSEYNAPAFIARHVGCPVINAGDSWREHPTQALLDALTMKRRAGTLAGLHVAICGDVAHSRVAHSNMILLSRMGAHVRIIAPPALMPQKFPAENITTFNTLEDGLPGADFVMMLRLQKERMEAGLIGSEQDYFRQYGLTVERLALAKPGAFVMHPGPMNRNVEIADDVADHKDRSLILEQARNGVPTRMAVMELLMTRRK